MEKLAFKLGELSKASGCGPTALYEEIESGRLVARKRGRSTIVLADDAKTWLQSLPLLDLRPETKDLESSRAREAVRQANTARRNAAERRRAAVTARARASSVKGPA
jgi:hypothetical protein